MPRLLYFAADSERVNLACLSHNPALVFWLVPVILEPEIPPEV
jgi:hypothetical protein